ncbi:MAG: hypothetical protein OXC94_11095 [Chloroflexi bacterium]|nr:hypothetical protein [Chloroflexota bacterium]
MSRAGRPVALRAALLLASVLVAAALATAALAVRGGGPGPDVSVDAVAPPAPAPADAPTPPAAAAATPAPVPRRTPTPAPARSVEQEVEAAYLAYWDAYAAAALHLDASLVEGFAAGEELRRIRAEIAALEARGVALRIVVEHDLLVVVTSPAFAAVVDHVTNRSFHVDPVSLEPPRAEGGGEVLRDTVFMERRDGRWVATGSQREGPR